MTPAESSAANPAADMEPSERPFRISLTNETEVAVNPARVVRAIELALSEVDYDDVTVSVAVVDDETIHELNRQFLKHDYPTDVLSFVLEDESPRLEGEIVVSVDTARQNAAEAGWSPDDELTLYIVHGALHLAGYRDKSPADAAEMRQAEAAVLDQLGIVRSSSDPRWQPEASESDSAAELDEEEPPL